MREVTAAALEGADPDHYVDRHEFSAGETEGLGLWGKRNLVQTLRSGVVPSPDQRIIELDPFSREYSPFMIILMVMFVASGFLLAGVSVPLILGRIPPNGLYGFRVRKTMEHPEIWYPVNKYGGQRLLLSSVQLILAAIGLTFIPGLPLDIYAYGVLIIWVIGSSLGIGAAFRYMNRL
jgi:hypothetical protein